MDEVNNYLRFKFFIRDELGITLTPYQETILKYLSDRHCQDKLKQLYDTYEKNDKEIKNNV